MEHPKCATNLQCLGYTSDHRRCRLERYNDKTCTIHRNYYTNWLEKHPLNSYTTYNTIRKRNEIIFHLKTGNIILSQNYIQYNFGIGNIREYLFLIKYANINPLWNRTLFEYYILHNILQIDMFNEILISHETCIEALKYILGNKLLNINWDYILTAPGWKNLMCSPIFIDTLKTKDQNDTLLPIFLEKQKSLMNEQILFMKELRDELLAVCWHPSRIQHWKHEILEWAY